MLDTVLGLETSRQIKHGQPLKEFISFWGGEGAKVTGAESKSFRMNKVMWLQRRNSLPREVSEGFQEGLYALGIGG